MFAAVPTTAGAITAAPSAGNNVMVVNGTNGIVALGSRFTLVADNSRVLEVDGDGLASWAVDATSQLAPNGAVTHLEMNHPSTIFQQAPNDYLVADTGNNRCVRFDRGGNVAWELTRFNDTAGHLSARPPPDAGRAEHAQPPHQRAVEPGLCQRRRRQRHRLDDPLSDFRHRELSHLGSRRCI